jgi:hypothetical protein
MDKRNIISYYTYRRIANKHDIKVETITGKPVTYNKLKHRVDDFERKKLGNMNNNNVLTEAITEQQLHNNIVKYINCEIDENEMNNIMYHYIGT